jgi:exodeoxyribonuclease V alpha subunit
MRDQSNSKVNKDNFKKEFVSKPLEAKKSTKGNELDKIVATIRLVTFHNPETGYCILRVNTLDRPDEDKMVTVNMASPYAGAIYEFEGWWTMHSKYGWQFKAIKSFEQKPASINGIEKYLGSGLIKGIGRAMAKRIVDRFGEQTLDIFDYDISKLIEINGISEKKLEAINDSWKEHKHVKDIMTFLQSTEVSTLLALKIYRAYEDKAVAVVSQNPYRLASEVWGIGFLTADRIAQKLGISATSIKRLKAAILHTLQQARDNGHCYLTRQQLIEDTVKLLEMQESEKQDTQTQMQIESESSNPSLTYQELFDLVNEAIDKDIVLKEMKTRELNNNDTVYYAPSIYHDENYIASWIKHKISQGQDHFTNERQMNEYKRFIDDLENNSFFKLSEQQSEAIKSAFLPVSILTGGPGCGKTTVTKTIVEALSLMGKVIALGAPTGRAAQRMSEVIGKPAKTLHRLLEFNATNFSFNYNEKNPLPVDYLIVDESSMLDVHLTAGLLRAIGDKTQLLLVGDVDQLPSVGAGQILRDLIESNKIPTFHLTQIFRQAKQSKIIQVAHSINENQYPKILTPVLEPNLWQEGLDCMFIDSEEMTEEQLRFTNSMKKHYELIEQNLETKESLVIPSQYEHVDLDKLVASKSPPESLNYLLKKVPDYSMLKYNFDISSTILKIYTDTIPKYYPDREIQILSPMSRGSLGTTRLNQLIQDKVNPLRNDNPYLPIGNRSFRLGDRVIQKVNNYRLNVFNGDIGVITNIDIEYHTINVNFSLGRDNRLVTYQRENLLELDLAYAITIHKSQGSEFPVVIIPLANQHFTMLQKNLIYTALTRAKKLAVFVGSRRALRIAVSNNRSQKRQTALKDLLN